MNLKSINDAIFELESSETTFENVQELANLYTVKEHLELNRNNNNIVEEELSDILPKYKSYCIIKRRYQLHEITDDPVINAIDEVCKEIVDFIDTLYSSTDFYKERLQIAKMLEKLYIKYSK